MGERNRGRTGPVAQWLGHAKIVAKEERAEMIQEAFDDFKDSILRR
eukprot:CAMPEP_0118721488 /NCGR_PEP_ID=MMETSP0800-20121206/30761_1 /TAXON_ID=210618 ORGANISM="Striatella unipunctata, Strain CCMP2910" /NCGR_SAMPLE_ID=MMETSP0800 /ASSEMBLY_ACC=CAM_ASM_000638 /LENGTH=45 /DNA_ID= /DNA_START= /DNA_END= /DNA_ORIENTATION=